MAAHLQKYSVLGCWAHLRRGACWPPAMLTGPGYSLDKIWHRFRASHWVKEPNVFNWFRAWCWSIPPQHRLNDAACFQPSPAQLSHLHNPLCKWSSMKPQESCFTWVPARQPITLGMLGFPGCAQVVCARQVWHISCASYCLRAHRGPVLCVLCHHLPSIPTYFAGYSSDNPDGNPSQTGTVSLSTQFLEGNMSGETQVCGRPMDLDPQWVNFSVAWGRLYYRKCLPGEEINTALFISEVSTPLWYPAPTYFKQIYTELID